MAEQELGLKAYTSAAELHIRVDSLMGIDQELLTLTTQRIVFEETCKQIGGGQTNRLSEVYADCY